MEKVQLAKLDKLQNDHSFIKGIKNVKIIQIDHIDFVVPYNFGDVVVERSILLSSLFSLMVKATWYQVQGYDLKLLIRAWNMKFLLLRHFKTRGWVFSYLGRTMKNQLMIFILIVNYIEYFVMNRILFNNRICSRKYYVRRFSGVWFYFFPSCFLMNEICVFRVFFAFVLVDFQ